MSPEPPPPGLAAPPEPLPPPPPPPESYPFWGYLDLAAFILIALFALLVEAVLLNAFLSVVHVKPLFAQLPAQFILYGFLLWMLSVVFRRYYGRPFWHSLRWVPAPLSASFLVTCGILLAFAVMLASLLLRTPDVDSPMRQLLSDRTSMLLVAVFGITLGPVCEEIFFRGFLQPLLVRSLGPAPGILAAALPFGLLHLQEYGYSWRHGLLITLAGAAFGWMRHRTGSTRAAAVMHAAYNFVFFLLLLVQQAAPHLH
jgi:membrane protease YdiL (CAAX protease family)